MTSFSSERPSGGGTAVDSDPMIHTATLENVLAQHGHSALVMVSVFLAFLAIGAALPVVPLYARNTFHAGDVAIGMIMGVQALVAVLSRPLAGRVGPRIGWKLILQCGLGLLTFGTACYLIPIGLSGLALARIICGIGEAMVLTAGGAWMVARAHESRRGRVLGLFGLAMWGGMAIGPVLGDLASRHIGVPAVWILGAILGAAGVAVISLSRDDGSEVMEQPPQHGLVPPSVIAPGAVMTLATIGYSAIATFLSLHLRARGLSSGPEVYAVFGLSFVASRGLFGGIVDKAGAARVACVAAAGAASGLAILAIWFSRISNMTSATSLSCAIVFQRAADDERPHRRRLGELDRRLPLRRAGDQVHLVGAVLPDRGGHLPQPVHHLLLDLLDHVAVAEMDLADVDRAERIAPVLRLRAHLVAHQRCSWCAGPPACSTASCCSGCAPWRCPRWRAASRADRRS
jgi:MFS family permease